MSLPVALWIRVSTQDQANGDAPEHHLHRGRAYATAKGWNVVTVYDLSGVSGKSVSDNKEAQRMLADVASGKVKALIFSKLARLARNTKELLEFADYFKEHNANLISLSESIDTSSPSGRLFFTIIAAMATWERDEIAERVALSVPVRAKLGKNTGGQASYGYMWKDKKLIPDPKEAPVRALMYDLFLEHKRKKLVARTLNERGYRTRNGSKWSDTTVERLLRDSTAKGVHKANYTTSPGQHKAAVIKDAEHWVFRDVEPVVSVETWNNCQSILSAQKSNTKKIARKGVALFSGKTMCHCGGPMYLKSQNDKYSCKKCKNKISPTDLEAVFESELSSFLLSDEELHKYLDEGQEAISKKEEELEVQTKLLGQVKTEMEKLYQLYLAGGLDVSAFKERNGPLKARRQEVELNLASLEGEIQAERTNVLGRDEVVSGAKDLAHGWKLFSSDDKKALVDAVVDNITVGVDEIDISLHYLPHKQSNKATNPQGFMAATSWKRAGKVM
jgi:site-specific DNA recombinase